MNSGIFINVYTYPRYCCAGYTEATEVLGRVLKVSQNSQKISGRVSEVLQNSQKITGLWEMSHRTYRKCSGMLRDVHPYPGYCSAGYTEATEVVGRVLEVPQNSQKYRVGFQKCHRTHRSIGYG